MRDLFSFEGPVMQFFHKTGELIFISALFLLFCIPVITAGSSVTSLYYATIKGVRRERGYVTQEFMRSMKRTFIKGAVLTVGMIVWYGLLGIGLSRAKGRMAAVYALFILMSICISVYIFPVLSRFEMKLSGMVKLSFVMSMRYLYFTIPIAAGTMLLMWLQFYVLPAPCILVLPGAWCFAVTFMMEKVLLAYMPPQQEAEENGACGGDAWYYGTKSITINNGGRADEKV